MNSARSIPLVLISSICLLAIGCEQKSTKTTTPSAEKAKTDAEKAGKAAGEAVKAGNEAAKSGAEAAKEATKDVPKEE